MNRGLYIHYPFCKRKCAYCDFYSIANTTQKSEYVSALCREIKSFAQSNLKIDTIYFGGGTPSLMSVGELEQILNTVYTTFSVSKDAEITLEANPTSLETANIKDFKECGINRLSLGVQSFNDVELRALGRTHSAQNAIETFNKARQYGFENISIDLMFGIPHQTLKSFCSTLDTALSLNAEHISVYALSIEEKTVFGAQAKRGQNLFLPSEEAEEAMYISACQKLEQAGYEHYEISNFSKPDMRSRHNMKYWQGQEYIGVGASAHSYFEGVRYSTSADITQFCKKACRCDSYTNTPKDRAEEFVFLSLRLSDGLDVSRLKKEHSVHLSNDFDRLVQELSDNGLCTYSNNKLRLTDKGFFVSNSVIVKILDSLKI